MGSTTNPLWLWVILGIYATLSEPSNANDRRNLYEKLTRMPITSNQAGCRPQDRHLEDAGSVSRHYRLDLLPGQLCQAARGRPPHLTVIDESRRRIRRREEASRRFQPRARLHHDQAPRRHHLADLRPRVHLGEE